MNSNKISRLCVIILALMMCISGIIVSPVAGEDMGDENNTVVELNEENQKSIDGETNEEGQNNSANLLVEGSSIGLPILMKGPDKNDQEEQKKNEENGGSTTEKDEPKPYVGIDKTDLIKPTTQYTVTQYGKKLSDIKDNDLRVIDPEKPFEITTEFKFPIIKDENIGTFYAWGIDNSNQQVNEGDSASFNLGKGFTLSDESGKTIPVRIVSDDPKYNNKQVGNITFEKNEDGSLIAKMKFESNPNDDYGKFEYETFTKKEITVKFTGEFNIDNTSSPDPGPKDRVVRINDKDYKLPDLPNNTYYTFKKSGAIDDQKTKESITWECNIRKSSNKKSNLAGEKFTDELSSVGEYIENSLRFFYKDKDGKDIEITEDGDKPKYDKETNSITYEFPKDFNSNSAKITFRTKVSEEAIKNDKKAIVENEAKLDIDQDLQKIAKSEVPVHNPLQISKNYKKNENGRNKIGVDEKGDKYMTWTIIAGAPYENYGSAWIGDILTGKLKGQVAPTRIELSYEHSESGEKDTWKPVDSKYIKSSYKNSKSYDENFVPDSIRKFPDDNKGCPADLPNNKNIQIYELGSGWKNNPKTIKSEEGYEDVDNHWIFINELSGQYRITVTLYFDKNVEVGPLKNEAEIHVCNYDGIITKKPPIYSGIGTIDKESAELSQEDRQKGLLPWNITVDFGDVFPSDERYVYEAFYWGDKKDFDEKIDDLNKPDEIPNEVFEYLKGEKDDKDKPTRFNFNQSYVQEPLKLIPDSNEAKDPKEGSELENNTGTTNPEDTEVKLTANVCELLDNEGNQVGEIVKISGFDKEIKYKFTLKTKAKNIIAELEKETPSRSIRYDNTAVLAVGNEKNNTFRALPASANQTFNFNLLSKKLLDRKTDPYGEKDSSSTGDAGDDEKETKPVYLTNLNSTLSSGDGDAFNYKDRTILFRIDVNPQGLKFNELSDKENDDQTTLKFNELKVTDNLGRNLELVNLKDGKEFLLYKAAPAEGDNANVLEIVNPENAKVSFDREKKTWTFKDYNGEPYVIVIKAKVNEVFFKNYMEGNTGDYLYFNNDVSMIASDKKIAQAGTCESAHAKLLNKNAREVDKENKKLNWSFEYKPFDLSYKDVNFVDTLDKNVTLPINDKGDIDLENFKVSKKKLKPEGIYEADWEKVKVKNSAARPSSDSEVNVSYDKKDHKIIFRIPNTKESYSYKFEYATILNVKPGDEISSDIQNSVKMFADKAEVAGDTSSVNYEDFKAFATIDESDIIFIQKVNENKKPLEGAVFKCEITIGDASKSTILKTDEDGYFFIPKINGAKVKITETQAPDGYKELEKSIEFDMDDQGNITNESLVNLEGSGTKEDPLIVKNYKKPEEPGEPEEPDKPDKPDKSDKPGKPKSPGTGDNGFGYTYSAMAVIAALGILYLKRKNEYSE